MAWNAYYGKIDGAIHLALDELFFEQAKKGKYTLLISEYTKPLVVLCHAQHTNDYLGNGKIDYTRSFTPGGAMICDKNVLGFTMAFPRRPMVSDEEYAKGKGPTKVHRRLGGAINDILASLGVRDTIIGEQFYIKVRTSQKNLPIVGTSQRMEQNAVLYHGVITLDAWNADYVNSIIKLRVQNNLREYDKIKELPYVLQYSNKPLDEIKREFRVALSEKIAGTTSVQPVPNDVLSMAEDLVSKVYRNDEWRRHGQHPFLKRLSCKKLEEGLGFCLLGSEFSPQPPPRFLNPKTS